MTTTRHPEPNSCRKEYRVFPLKNETADQKNSMHTGTDATSALSNVTFIVCRPGINPPLCQTWVGSTPSPLRIMMSVANELNVACAAYGASRLPVIR